MRRLRITSTPAALAIVLLAGFTLSGCTSSEKEEVVIPEETSSLPDSPVTDRLAGCLQDAGWTVDRSWTGGIEADVPAEQMEVYNSAFDACSESSGWSAAQKLDEDQIRLMYQQEIEEHECLQALDLDSAEPPSEQQYVDTYQTAEQYYAFLPAFDSLGKSEMFDAVAACPPPTWFINLPGT